MENPDRIKEALSKLDKANDAHWTGDGLPRLDVVSELSGIKDIRRKDLTELAPTFTRDAPVEPEATDVRTEGVTSAAPLKPSDQPQPEPEETVSQDDLDEAEFELAEATKAMAELDAYKAKIAVAAQRAAERVDRALLAREALAPKRTCVHDIQDYLSQTKRQREARGEQLQAMRAANFDPRTLVAGAPIDNAMKRKTGYGHQRPDFNKPKE